MSSENQAFIGLGSNLGSPFGGRRVNLETALARLSRTEGIRIVKVSSVYETAPMGPQDQGLFLNAAAALMTELQPEPLLDVLLAVEDKMGRVRERHWGPRLIDLDLLLFGQRVLRTKRLTLPHPEMANREFVLAPLAEIAPLATHPVSGITVAEMNASVAEQGVRRLEKGLSC